MPSDPRNSVHALGMATVLAIVLTAVLAGCASVAHTTATTQPAQPAAAAKLDPAVGLLDYARHLREATPDQRADAVAGALRKVNDTPSSAHLARLALAYGTPNQRRYTPDEAARYAQQALDADDAHWSLAAKQYLLDYARLYTAITKPQAAAATAVSAAAQAGSSPRAAHDQRGTHKSRARIARLQAELDEAHRKLRELADIEDHLGETQP